jgi:glutathione S-transferase
MALRLYVVHGSHPCAAVEKALQMKGLEYKVWEWPPPLQAPMQSLLFGRRTVPALRNGAEKISGSRTIMRRLDEMVPQPPLYPADPALRARVEEAERWGDEEFQQDGRDIIWPALVHRPAAMVSYGESSRLPLPASMVRLSSPVVTRGARRLNKTNDDKARRRLQELPAKLDKIDAWIADGTIGDVEHPNAADLQILSTVRLLSTIGDAAPALAGRPCLAAALAVFPAWDGALPAGALA